VDAVAFKVNGDVTSVLFTGLLTVTPARAGKVMVRASTEMRVDLRAMFIECPFYDCRQISATTPARSCNWNAERFWVVRRVCLRCGRTAPTSYYSATSDHDVSVGRKTCTAMPKRIWPNQR
jgi:hypothetical protein